MRIIHNISHEFITKTGEKYFIYLGDNTLSLKSGRYNAITINVLDVAEISNILNEVVKLKNDLEK